jgi:hypothetical protein
MVRHQNGGQCRKPQEGGQRGCYRKLLEKKDIAGRAEIGSCHSGGRRRSVRRGGRRSVRRSVRRGGRRSGVRRSGGRRSGGRRSVRGGNYGCKQPKWGKECL